MKNTLLKIGIVVSPLLFFVLAAGPVKAEPYGWSPSVDNSWQGPPTCGDAQPKAPILYQPNHPLLPRATKPGEVRLNWIDTESDVADHNVYIGLSPKNYIQTAINVGRTNNFTVRFLANKTYYFAVQAKKGCAASKLSNEWSGRPGGGYTTVLGAASGYVPVTVTAPAIGEPVVEPTAEPTEASVQGVQAEPTTYQAPLYNPPTLPVRTVTPTPKPRNWLQNLIFMLFGR